MATKKTAVSKAAQIVSRNAEKAALARLDRKVLTAEISGALIEVLNAEIAHEAANVTLQQVAQHTASIWWNAWSPKPANGKAMDAAVASIKKGAEADGIKAKYSDNAWLSAFSHVSNYLYLLMSPKVTVASPRKKDSGVRIDVQAAGTNARLVSALASEARRVSGTGRKKSAKTPSAPPVVSAQSVAAHEINAFEATTKNVLALIERVLAMPSGIGLIGDALKVHGWLLVPTAEKKAALDADNAALQLKRKSAEMAEAAKAALLARAAKRTGKAKAKRS
jgi:hypothetical protein